MSKTKRINHASIMFGKRVLFFRKKAKLSRKELSAKTHLSEVTIMLVEKGEVEPQLITAFRLAEALDFKFDDLRTSVL